MRVKRGARAVEAAALKAIERAKQSGPPRDEYNEMQGALSAGAPPLHASATPSPDGSAGLRPQHRRDRVLQTVPRHGPRQPRARLRRLRSRPHEALQRPQDQSARLSHPHAPSGRTYRPIASHPNRRTNRRDRPRKP